MADQDSDAPIHGVAIIGMAGRFPGAPDLLTYWRNLRAGVESITFFDRERLAAAGLPDTILQDPSYVRARGTLDGVDLFDAPFFGYSPREATIMDPQQRFFLECSWEALEAAGYDPKTFKGLIGVYGGATASSYMPLVYADPVALAQSDPLSIAIGNEIAFLTTRVSYKLDLRGPSCPVQTACSTSLVAVHLACQGLLNAECDMAIAGGASIRVPQESGYLYQPSGILSPDGHCRPFDARAQGTLFSNGIGVVVLKRLDDALADGDTVYAVIRGSAINNDGSRKASFTAPAVGGQGEVIADALMNADVEPETISYIEAHGTATSLGDSIEMQALSRAFPADGQTHYCALGSVKSNLGHLDAAAGMAGLIKTVLALRHEELPASLHFERPNPDIDFAGSAFHVNAHLTPWPRRPGAPRRAGVSAFGFGGTNAHVVLEEAPEVAPTGPSRPLQLLTLSAESPAALEQATRHLADHLRTAPPESFADVAYTLQIGRRGFRHRRAVLARDAADAVRAIDTCDPGSVFDGLADAGDRPVVFMFPGQGAQHPGMARELYDREPLFREIVDDCADRLRAPLGLDLRTILYPVTPESPEAAETLRRTRYAQPALFVVEYALARLWMAWGIRPEACIGHSIGEFVAACLAGVFDLGDALSLVALRGELMERMPEGVMLAVPLPPDRVRNLLTEGLWLSVVNAPSACVVSGRADDVDGFERRLQGQGVQAQRLQTSHAFHSGLMDGAVAPFVAAVAKVTRRAPKLPYLSNVTGTWIQPAQANDPAYWGQQLREAVRFSDGVAELLTRDARVFLEVGPGQTLTSLVRQQARGRAGQHAWPSLRHVRQGGSDAAAALTALGRVWLAGGDVVWADYWKGESRRRIALPTYPFQRQRYWVTPRARAAAPVPEAKPAGKIASVDRWFYAPSWRRVAVAASAVDLSSEEARATWMVFADRGGLGEAVAGRLQGAGQRVIVVRPAGTFTVDGPDRFGVPVTDTAAYRAVLEKVTGLEGRLIVLHLWSLDASGGDAAVDNAFADARTYGFNSLLRLAQALEPLTSSIGSMAIGVVTAGAQEVTGDEALSPGAAAVLGLCRVIPQEVPDLSCTHIDLAGGTPDTWTGRAGRSVDWLLRELLENGGDRAVAFRGGHKWVLHYEPVRLDTTAPRSPLVRERGVYLITGGLGDIGLHVAEYLARTAQARLCLTGRGGLPVEGEWEAYLARHAADDPTAARIRRLRRIQALGGEVLVVQADAGDREAMSRAFDAVHARFGALHGIVHGAGLVMGDAFRPLGETDDDICRRQFAPKIAGVCVIDSLVRERALAVDFVLLISSLSSMLGGLRFAAYASANAFLDAFAFWRQRDGGARWITINWDSWRRADDPRGDQSDPAELVMTGAEGVEALHRILCGDVGTQVLVSVGDLQARIDQWVRLKATLAKSEDAAEPAVRHPRPPLQTEYVAPSDALEQALAGIWQELLGVDRVGANDSFFELGGDSLLGLQVIARVKKQLSVSVSAVSLYEGPTVARLAGVIRAAGTPVGLGQSRSRGDRRREEKLRRLNGADAEEGQR